MSRQCPKCQANNPANSIFCAECGTDLRAVQPNNAPSPAQPTYVYTGQQTPSYSGPSSTGPATMPAGSAQPTYMYGNDPRQPGTPADSFRPAGATYVQSNATYVQPGYPNTPATPYTIQPSHSVPAPAAQARPGRPALIIVGAVLAFVVVVGGIALASQPRSGSTPTATPSNQANTVTTATPSGQASPAGNATQPPSTIDLLNPNGDGNSGGGATPAPNTSQPTPAPRPTPTATPQSDFKNVRGPENAQLVAGEGRYDFKGFDSPLNLADFYASATFTNPYAAPNQGKGWDYGFFFRDLPDGSGAYVLVINSQSQWNLGWVDGRTGQYTAFSNGTVTNLNLSAGNKNAFGILVQGNQAIMVINGHQQTSTITLPPDNGITGDVKAVAGYFIEDNVPGSTTNVENFTVEVHK